MFIAEKPHYTKRDKSPSRFMLLVNNEGSSSRITQFLINEKNKPECPTSVSVEEAVKKFKKASPTEKAVTPRMHDPRILVETEQYIVWHYRPSKEQKLFLKHSGRNINQRFPFPSLVFAKKKETNTLYVTAMRHHKRPSLSTRLYQAPLPNVGADANICLGSVVLPKTDDLDAISEEYLNSYKTHLNNHNLFRKGETTDYRFYKWAKEAIKNNKLSLADVCVYGSLRDFIQRTTGIELEG
ncbi:hypothetical protein F7U66_02070 [Vibrio parahaemolyticus]|nr:hypothetical protein [Vibrio parahaemolyticus]